MKNIRTGTPSPANSANKKNISHCRGKNCSLLSLHGLTRPADSSKETLTCCAGLIDRTGRVPLPCRGCGEGGEWRAISHKMSGPSVETCGVPQPLQQGLAIDHHWGPIEEGMWLKQACVKQWSIVWPTCLSSWASMPLIEGVDSLYMVHKALSVSPLGQKRWFSARGHTHYHVVAPPPQPAVSISWMDFVAEMVYMFVCVWRGEATKEESSLLRHIARGRTHTAYHKGASGRKNVYMMSNDSPKIGLPS